MRNFFLSLFIIFVIAAASAPYVDGLIFKHEYMKLLAQLQQLDINDNVTTQITVENYHVGWLTSTADLKAITTNHDPRMAKVGFPSIEMTSKLVVHHGPVIIDNNKPKFAFAEMEQYVFLPSMLKGFLSETDKGFLQIKGSINFSTHAWTSTMTVQPMTFGPLGKWEGATADGVIEVGTSGIKSINSTGTFGRIDANLPMIPLTMTINPINGVSNMSFVNNQPTSLSVKINLTGASASSNDKSIFSLKGISFDESMSSNSDSYNFMLGSKVSGLAIDGAGKFSSIPEINYSINMMNIDKNGVSQLKEVSQSINGHDMPKDALEKLTNAYLNLIMNGSKFDMSLSGSTNLGAGASNISVTFLQKPKTLQDILTTINFKADLKIARPLLTEILAHGLSYNITEKYHHTMNAPSADGTPADFQARTAEYQAELAAIPTQTAALIDQLVKQGILLLDGDNLSLSASKTGEVINYNGATDSPIAGVIKQMLANPAMASQLSH